VIEIEVEIAWFNRRVGEALPMFAVSALKTNVKGVFVAESPPTVPENVPVTV
jgi:hypothetical protein